MKMKFIQLKNGRAKVEISDNRTLYVSKCNNLYDLTLQRPTASGRGTINAVLCEDKRRISTINKHAVEFGVRFVEENKVEPHRAAGIL